MAEKKLLRSIEVKRQMIGPNLPDAYRRRIRTSNMLERVNQEIKHRTRVGRIFPNQSSCLRLVSAILIETDEDWETGRIYLNIGTG